LRILAPLIAALASTACADRPHGALAPAPSESSAPPSSGTATIASDIDCRFPDEAEGLGIDEADVVLRVTVAPTGAAEGAVVLRDPGHGFREAALECALAARYVPARNPAGTPTRATTRPFRIHFLRSR
jgi:protein TonB